MAIELRLVERDVLDADAAFVATHLDDLVDEQEGIAVRKKLQDPQNICGIEGFRFCRRLIA